MLKRFGTVLLIAGGAMLVWTCTVWASIAIFQSHEQRKWQGPEALSVTPSIRNQIPKPHIHDVIGWLEIPRLQVSTAVLEGDDDESLRYGAGHIPSTPMPPGIGNIGLA